MAFKSGPSRDAYRPTGDSLRPQPGDQLPADQRAMFEALVESQRRLNQDLASMLLSQLAQMVDRAVRDAVRAELDRREAAGQ